jgi:hypothetical protein
VLPNPEYLPSGLAERLIDQPVSRDVAVEFWTPVLGVRNRIVSMEGASVPKTPVDEDREPLSGEDHIRADSHSGCVDWQVFPKAIAVAMEP